MTDILVVDDEIDIGELIKDIIEDELTLKTSFVLNSSAALETLKKTSPKAIILDVWLEGSDMDGLGLLKLIKEKYKDIPVIVISGHGNIETAVKAIKWGAYDFIEKPFKSEKLILTVKRTIENADLKQCNTQLNQKNDLASLIGKSKQIIEIKNKITSNSTDNVRTLIRGEVGVGKERLAKLIHNYSNLAEKPFFQVNLESHPEEELEALLFGSDNSRSIFEKAKGATLYLNNISALSSRMQTQLLRCINNLQTNQSRCRVICSSIVDIKQLVVLNQFNPDLYQRLSSMELYIPPLRDRKQDIEPITNYYINQFASSYGIAHIKVDDGAYSKLIEYDWPGNIMELKNFIENLVIKLTISGSCELNSGDISFTIPKVNQSGAECNTNFYDKNLKEAKKAFEKQYIGFQLQKFGGNISQVAKFIGMERPALHKKMRDLDL
ncbi:sigma-54-dependent transcriptional regulator [Candidatus Bandiella euplotis]|uniref:Putative response regulator NtrX-like n=1 Tax=Candidatus Bandiella euplotis TaxID=1664265 RepID=A0ABZ0UMX2_9RICK|nr:sigma-54 dependent transcriptional regulator [Candidatus Bandiella woodruffii]WPX96150.1 AtoC superfamily transcriptional regulator [Candidatus Bandiella woodruffii]